MARRSAVGHGRETAVAEEAAPAGAALGQAVDPWDAPEGDGRRKRSGGGSGTRGGRWSGSGGRWWIWVGRAVLWALIIVIVVNGVRAPFERFTADDSGSSGTSAPGKGARFPSSAAGAFALQFANVYLNYDQKNAGAREEQLRAFLPEESDGQFGWNGVGQQQVQSVNVAGVDVKDDHNGIVTVLARSEDRWLRLAVPVYAADASSLVVSGRPALLPPPSKAALPQQGVRERDSALESELQPVLGNFFPAYASSNQATLSRFSDGAAIGGLANTVTFYQVREIIAPRGPAGERTVTATVAWQLPGTGPSGGGGELEQTYELKMIKKGSTWYVRDIRGATPTSGS